jgi:hypothetical protein
MRCVVAEVSHGSFVYRFASARVIAAGFQIFTLI